MAGLTTGISLLPISGAAWKGVRYGCTTRLGGVSTGHWASLNLALHVGDDPLAVLENRRRLSAALPGEPFWLEQVHGTVVADADALECGMVSAGCAPPDESGQHAGSRAGKGVSGVALAGAVRPPRADAAVTTQAGRVLVIMTADCVPVVISDVEGRALGMAHAGWRGLAAGVLESTFTALRARLPRAGGWRAWVGPCIGQNRFEVGDEVRQAFSGAEEARYFAPGRIEGKWQADLAGLVCHRLAMMGVYDVGFSGLCTYERADLFHSYRRSPAGGRMATLAWRAPQV